MVMRMCVVFSIMVVVGMYMEGVEGTLPPPTNPTPTVGVLTLPTQDSECDTFSSPTSSQQSCFATLYSSWLEAAGAQVVPILYTSSPATLRSLARSVNGLVFTGGSILLTPNSTYYQAAQILFDETIAINREGGYLPLHGTCQGFQLLAALVAESTDVLSSGFDSEDLSLALDFTPQARESLLYGPSVGQRLGDGDSVYEMFEKYAITTNLHSLGVTPETFEGNPKLGAFFHLLSTNKDRKGRAFVSSMEAKTLPITATQYHPERTYEFVASKNINHSVQAVFANSFLGLTFVQNARRSSAAFPSQAAKAEALLYNYAPTPSGDSYQCFFFQ